MRSFVGRWLVIINPAANCGKGKKDALPFLVEIKRSGAEKVTIRETTHPGHATELARQAVAKRQYTGVIAIGGDGTANEVANGLIGSQLSLIVVPVGRGNDFVKSAIWVKKPREVTNLILRGENFPVDTIKIDGVGYSINGISIDDFATTVSQQVGSGPLAYFGPALRNLSAYKDKLYQISFGDEPMIEDRFLVFVIMNGGIAGKGFKFAPGAKISDGVLNTCLIKQVFGRLARLKYLLAVQFGGKHVNLAATEIKQIKKATITIPGASSITLQIDGEHRQVNGDTISLSVEPKSLLLRGLPRQP